MAAGPGFYDAQGVWQYGESTPAGPLFSDYLNLLADSTSDAIAADRVRLVSLEGRTPFAQAAGRALTSGAAGAINSPIAWGGIESVTFPVGRFTLAPIVTLQVMPQAGGTIMLGAVLESVTASGFTYRAIRVSASAGPVANTPVHWRAVQMTSISAAG